MAKKIGKLCALVVCVGTNSMLYAVPQLEMSLVDSHGHPLQQVAQGVDFTIQVNVIDGDGAIQVPKIKGLEQFRQGPVRTASKFSMVNGTTSSQRTFYYTVRSDKAGSYTIGPAQVMYQGDLLSSNVMTVIVGAQEENASTVQSSKAVTLSLSTDKHSIYIGEPLILTVRLEYEPDVQLTSQPAADFKKEGWLVRSQTEPVSGHISGTKRLYSEQKFEIYCYEPGERIIPRLSATYLMPTHRAGMDFDFFDIGDFFGRHKEQFELYSNMPRIQVKDLPEYADHVNGVAVIKHISASLDHQQAKEGEGIVLRLELVGDGDALHLEAPALNLPSGLKYYESKTDMVDNKHNGSIWKKIFEYIVQGTQPGTFQIPSQTFTYFDYEKGRYKNVSTQPLTLVIEGNAKTAIVEQPQIPNTEQSSEVEMLAPLYQGIQWHEQAYRFIPLYVFWLLVICLLLAIGAIFGWQISAAYRARYAIHHAKATIFKRAKQRLMQYKKQADSSHLYDLFMGLFAQKLDMADAAVTEDDIIRLLLKAGITEDKIKEWLQAMTLLAQQKYFHGSSTDKQRLFALSEQWLTYFEGVL